MSNPSHGYTIFEDGRLKPGLYKIQNLLSGTYLDIHEHSMEVCCRPASALEKNGGIVRVPCYFTFFSKPFGRSGKSFRSVLVIQFAWYVWTTLMLTDLLTRHRRNALVMWENPTAFVP